MILNILCEKLKLKNCQKRKKDILTNKLSDILVRYLIKLHLMCMCYVNQGKEVIDIKSFN